MIGIARPFTDAEEEEAVLRVLRSGQLASGPEVAAFENEFAAAMGSEHAVAVTNGTVALETALRAMGIGPGDEVIVPSFTFIATANAVLNVGAIPRYADVDAQSFLMEPEHLAGALTPRTKAAIPVHLYGHPCNLRGLDDVAQDAGIGLLGDAAQAHGAEVDGAGIGGAWDAQTWSLYPTKNIMSAEGGMITTDDAELADLARSIANHGRAVAEHGTYDHVRAGTNGRLSDLHAAIGRVQLRRLPEWLEARTRNAAQLSERLAGSAASIPSIRSGATHAWHQFTIQVDDRDAVRARLQNAGVGTGIYYPKALPEYAHLSGFRGESATGRALAQRCLSLPVHPGLDADAVQTVADAVLASTTDLPTPA